MYNKWLLWFLIISLRCMNLTGCCAVEFEKRKGEKSERRKSAINKKRRNKTSNINYLNNTFVCLSKGTDWRLIFLLFSALILRAWWTNAVRHKKSLSPNWATLNVISYFSSYRTTNNIFMYPLYHHSRDS